MNQQTLQRLLPKIGAHLPHLWACSGQLLPLPPDAHALASLGLVDERGLTRKGQRVLDHLQAIADTLDIPIA